MAVEESGGDVTTFDFSSLFVGNGFVFTILDKRTKEVLFSGEYFGQEIVFKCPEHRELLVRLRNGKCSNFLPVTWDMRGRIVEV